MIVEIALIVIIIEIFLGIIYWQFFQKRRQDLQKRWDYQKETSKLQQGYYQNPRNIKGNCPHCGSNNVEKSSSYRFYHKTFTRTGDGSGTGGGTFSVPVDENVYTCTCKKCGHVWQIKE